MTKTEEIMKLADTWMFMRLHARHTWSDVEIAHNALKSTIEELVADAARYRWIKGQKALEITSDGGSWSRQDGTKFVASHRLAVGNTQYGAYETLDETVDAAMEKTP